VTQLKVLIVDDEPPARERLKSLLIEIPDTEVVGEAINGPQSLERAHELTPDVVLLDVRMPGMDGIEVARHLNALEEPPAVIFTTAFDEYAVNAFEAHAIGYLLKPQGKAGRRVGARGSPDAAATAKDRGGQQ
jgi:two-component system, LytTR family, response regulator AlgR